ncbi:GNAT family N-acetyltransferase [bacterium]|nr:GNAT family N-acetyltransferase [bacterium]
MSDIRIEILGRDDERLDQLPPLFRDYYESMSDKGLQMPLVENGEHLWLDGLRKSLGRFYQMVATVEDDRIVGFVFGYIRITPPYLGSKKVGYVDGLYLEEQHRTGPLVLRMIRELQMWFRERDVDSLELQVLTDNEHAWKLWESLGFKRELYQMRKQLRP